GPPPTCPSGALTILRILPSDQLINPSLSEAAQPGLGTVITQLHLLHRQPSLYGNSFPEDAGWRLQPFKWSSGDQAQIQFLKVVSCPRELTSCQPGNAQP
ncbi:hypothetical protein KUCAC02_022564, partial [Chaenocephalus aceratus]